MIRSLFYSWMFLFLLLCSCTSKTVDKAETTTNDSIKKYLDLAGNDSLDIKLRSKYNDKAFSLVDLNKNDTLTRFNVYKVCYNYNLLFDYSKMEKPSYLLIGKSLEAKDSLAMGRGFLSLGISCMMQSKNDEAIKNLFKAKKIFSIIGLKEEELKALRNISITQSYANDYLGSIKTCYEILKISKKFNLNKEINNTYNNIANNLTYLKNNKKAIEYYKRVNYDGVDYNSICILNNNMAQTYLELKNYEKAIYHLEIILKDKRINKIRNHHLAVSYSLLALYNLKTNRLKKLPLLFFKADSIFNKKDSFSGKNYNQIYLSEYYIKVSDTSNAIKAAKRSFSISKSYKNPTDVLISLKQLINVDKVNASINAQEFIRISDSLQIEERRFRDKFAQIIYETNEINQEKETAIKQKWVIAFISGVVILIIFLILVITRQRSKQKELQLLQSQQQANEEIYDLMLTQKNKEEQARQSEKNRIALELHDGVMNKLASTRLNLNILSHKNDKQTIEKCLIHIEGIYQIEQEIRNISHNLNQEVFSGNNSFITLLEDFVATQNNTAKTHYQIEIDKTIDWSVISSSVKMNLYRIIQEASNNINKFAQAKKTIISLMVDENNLCLAIIDDGKGFDTEKQTEGIGLKNIKQRVEILQGKFVIQSIKNKSTSLNIAFPLK